MKDVITNNPKRCDEALVALHHVIDPEIGLNIVDLGLLYQLDFDEANRQVYASMTLTIQFCPMGDSIRRSAVENMRAAFPTYGIHLNLVFDPPWGPERISKQGSNF